MIRRIVFLSLVATNLVVGPMFACADEPSTQAELPFWTFFASSLDRLQTACEHIFASVDRPDLALSIEDRLKTYRDLAGIDRTKPIGLMSTWDEKSPEEIIFVPVQDIRELLKTATFGILGFHQVKPDHYEIERPGSPYHVLVRRDYAFFADSVPTIRALRIGPEQLTRGLRKRYDVVLTLDLLQIPQPVKTRFVADLRSQIEPWLQPQDDELVESSNLRRILGELVLDSIERVALDTKRLTLGGRLDSDTRQFSLEVTVEAVAKSRMATGLNRMSSHRSEFSPLIQPDVPAGVAFNLPISGLIDQILGLSEDRVTKGSQLDAAFQLAGSGLGDLSLIAAVHGPDAGGLGEAIPRLLRKAEKTGQFKNVCENFDVHRSVILHSLTPRELPTLLTQWIGSDVEILVGQDQKTVWLGMGNPKPLLDRLLDAIDLMDEPQTSRPNAPLVRARFQAQKLPELVASDLIVPNSDAQIAREAFSKGQDGFQLTIEPITDGLKLRVEFEEGFTKLIGQSWIRQLERPSDAE